MYVTDITDEEKKHITKELCGVISSAIVPSTEKAVDFLSTCYSSKTRPATGVSCLARGAEYYIACLHWHTSTTLSAEAVHQLGLQEVDRIRACMEQVKEQVGFQGTLAEFFTHLKNDKQFYLADSKALLAEFEEIIPVDSAALRRIL